MRHFMVLVLGMLASAALAGSGQAQFMYLDSDADGVTSAEDRLSQRGPTDVDIWISTDRHQDGTLVRPADSAGGPLSIVSYEVILRAVGGSVEWGTFRNCLEGADFQYGPLKSPTEFYVFRGGMKPSAPGTYKLGTVVVRAISGNPRLVFGERTSLWSGAGTSFGSNYHGRDEDNTLKFTEDPTRVGGPAEYAARDWAEAKGLGPADGGSVQAATLSQSARMVFTVEVSPNPANPQVTITVTTTRPGYLRVRIFDVKGRLTRNLLEEGLIGPGRHTVSAPSSRDRTPLSSGIYFYRVEASEATRSGKLIILK